MAERERFSAGPADARKYVNAAFITIRSRRDRGSTVAGVSALL